jgi:DNA polymerase V
MFALADVNSFYASCEKVFRPDLRDRPVIVLSNNDGCVIARSREARAIGIPMGAPWFKVKGLAEKHNVAVFSSNYSLYHSMSERVMRCLEALAPRVEQYSIDEMFLDVAGIDNCVDFEDFGRQLRVCAPPHRADHRRRYGTQQNAGKISPVGFQSGRSLAAYWL